MPNVKVMFWNVQNFGDANPCRGNYVPLCNFIAEVVKNADADILCLMPSGKFGLGRDNNVLFFDRFDQQRNQLMIFDALVAIVVGCYESWQHSLDFLGDDTHL